MGKAVVETQYTTVTPSPGPPTSECLDPSSIRVSEVYDYRGPQGLASRRSTEVRFNADGSGGWQKFDVGYSYDRWANLSQIQYPTLTGLSSCAAAPTVDLTWDPAGLLGIQETVDGQAQAVLSSPVYDVNTGMMTSWQTPAGVRGGTPAIDTVRHVVTPDGTRPRVQQISASRQATPSSPFFDTGTYTYDAAGNVTGLSGHTGVTRGWQYLYDALLRVTSATETWGQVTQLYQYDDPGNLTSLGGQAIQVDHATNRLSATGTQYDTRGNLTAQPTSYGWTRWMRYDPLNRLVTAWATGSGAPTSRYAFAYDQAGERVLKYRVDGGVVKEVYFYVRDEAGNTLSELLWGTQSEERESRSWTRDADWVYAGREPVVRLGRQNTTNYRTYTTLVTDHLGSTRAEVLSTSSPTKMDYWPYGDLFSQPPLITEKHMFTAQEREFLGSAPSADALGDLDQMHQREYGFRMGRFLSLDPIRTKGRGSQGWNRYSYVTGGPLALIDPFGADAADPNQPHQFHPCEDWEACGIGPPDTEAMGGGGQPPTPAPQPPPPTPSPAPAAPTTPTPQLSARDKAYLDKYLGPVTERAKHYKVWGVLVLGVGYESSFASAGTYLLTGDAFGQTGGSTEHMTYASCPAENVEQWFARWGPQVEGAGNDIARFINGLQGKDAAGNRVPGWAVYNPEHAREFDQGLRNGIKQMQSAVPLYLLQSGQP